MIPKSILIASAAVSVLVLAALFLIHPAPEPEDRPLIGTVTRVVDGDTFDVVGVGRIRLADVDCPEQRGAQGKAATEYARNQLEGRKVELKITDHDKYDRTVAHVYLLSPTGQKGAHFNKMIVAAGHAVIKDYPDTTSPGEWCPDLLCRYPVVPYVPGERMYELPDGYGKARAELGG